VSIDEVIQQVRTSCPDIPIKFILNTEQATATFGNNTSGKSTHVDLAVTITHSNQIGKILKLANEGDFSVCPISTGNNWGYGSVNPTDKRKLLILNLKELNAITEIDKASGLIRLEPGVTQQQLALYLEEHSWHFMTPVTGAGPSCSIVSNALERGYGPNPQTDHFSAITSLRYYIAHPAHCHREHYSAITSLDKNRKKECDCDDKCDCPAGQSTVDASHKWGLGPYVDGLFTQSNLGIVTKATLRLAPIPEKFCSFFIKCKRDDDFGSATAFIKKLLMAKGGELGIVNLMDKRRIISMVADNPNPKDHHIVMTAQQIAAIAKKLDVAEWTIMGSIYSTKENLKGTKKFIKKQAKFSDDILFSDSIKIPISRVLTKFIMKERRPQLDALPLSINIMLGKPNRVALRLAYWRNPKVDGIITEQLLPDVDKCGLLWYAPLVPMNKEKMTEFAQFVRATTPQFGIEPFITFTNLNYDYVDSTIPIVFDLNNPQAVEQAHRCLDTLFDEGLKKGFVPYRLNTLQQKTKLDPKAPHWQITNLIKQALDPNNVINPERYNPT
jgi:4-cresol dehydrogenase (hydroxylating)